MPVGDREKVPKNFDTLIAQYPSVGRCKLAANLLKSVKRKLSAFKRSLSAVRGRLSSARCSPFKRLCHPLEDINIHSEYASAGTLEYRDAAVG